MKKNIIRLKIDGMSCASCAARVESKLNSLSGIDANVDIVTHSASISIDNSSVSIEDIIIAIKSLGYSATEENEFSATDNSNKTVNTILRVRLIVAIISGLFFMILMILHLSNYHSDNIFIGDIFQLIIASFVIFFSGYNFLKKFISGFMNFSLSMDTLVALGSLASYFLSIYNMVIGKNNELYFESIVFLILFVLLGKFLEERSLARTSNEIKKLLQLSPEEATLVVKSSGVERNIVIKTKDISIGQLLRVKPGEKIPVDGMIQEGEGVINEAMLTGESRLSEKGIGERVFAGTINTAHSFVFKAEKIGEDTLLGNVIKLVNEAKHSKLPVQKLVDKVSLFFVPSVIVISIVVLLLWIFLDKSYSIAIINAVSVLVIACPCALGLATPVAIMVALGKASSLGIFVKKSEALQKISKVTDIAFDKTGTLTVGKFTVSNVFSVEENEADLIAILASIEKYSEHPIASSILEYAEENDIQLYAVENFKSYSGFGVTGEVNKTKYVIGTRKFLIENGINIENFKLYSSEDTSVFIGSDGKIIGFVQLSDSIKHEAYDVIKNLDRNGINCYLLSGDTVSAVKRAAEELKMKNYHGGLLPADKCNFIKGLRQKGKVIAMVGDGINDAPVLSEADIGISMANGSEVAIETGDIVLGRGDLSLVLSVIKLSKITMRKIKQNLFWAVIYNVICIPIAALGFLNPGIAGLAMAISSICVVINSLSIMKCKTNF